MVTILIFLWIITAGVGLFLWAHIKTLWKHAETNFNSIKSLTQSLKQLATECEGMVNTQIQFQENLKQIALKHNALNDDYLKLKSRLNGLVTTIDEEKDLPSLNKDYGVWVVQQVRAIFERLNNGKGSVKVLRELEENIVYAQHKKLLSADQVEEITNILLEAYNTSTNGSQVCRLATKLLKLVNA